MPHELIRRGEAHIAADYPGVDAYTGWEGTGREAHFEVLPTAESNVLLRFPVGGGEPLVLARLPARDLILAFLNPIQSLAFTHRSSYGHELTRLADLRAKAGATLTVGGSFAGVSQGETLFVRFTRPAVLQHLLRHRGQPPTLSFFLLVDRIRTVLEKDEMANQKGFVAPGWSADIRVRLLEDCRVILARRVWTDLVREGLESSDSASFREAVAAANALRINETHTG